MSNKALRILIADGELIQRIKIEKMLNQLGYCRIAPMSSFKEIQSVTGHQGSSFDLLIINAALVRSEDVNLLKFCHETPQIRHALIYDGRCTQSFVVSVPVNQTIHLSLFQTPDCDSLRRCLDVVDPARGKPRIERPLPAATVNSRATAAGCQQRFSTSPIASLRLRC